MAAAGDMPIIGPNCYGVVNYMSGAVMWPDQHGGVKVDGGVAIITQSGNMALNFTMQQRAMPLAMLICLGNQANTRIQDCLAAMIDDPRITTIGLHIEGLSDIASFAEVAVRALRAKKSVVALKTGRSATGASIAQSHTASLVGSDDLYDALFDRVGIARVDCVDEFLETLKFLSLAGPLENNRVASMSCSGGEASLIADLAESTTLEFPTIGADQHQHLFDALGERVSISNPLDYHTYVWGQEERMQAAFAAMMSGDYAASMLVFDFVNSRGDNTDWWTAIRAYSAAAKVSPGEAIVLATLGESIDEDTAFALISKGLIPMLGMQQTLVALQAACKIGRAQQAVSESPVIDPNVRSGDATNLSEWRATRLLQDAGLTIPNSEKVTSPEDAVVAADAIGYPVVMKIVSSDVVHKTEAGGVVLNVADAESVRSQAMRLLALSDAVMVAEMVDDPVAEMIIGVTRDPLFGPYLVIGLGGVTVELIRDTRILLLPASDDDIRDALLSLQLAPLLQGYRGAPAADVEAIVVSVQRVAEFVATHRDAIMDLEINPLLVKQQGAGAYVADAYMNLVGGEPHE
ncbi:MAG: acetate--CoA ligase family protein [Pseudomonadota bacterium]